MSGFENWPAPILRRWLLSTAAGPVIFLIGLAGRIALHDPTLLTLSTLLASCIRIVHGTLMYPLEVGSRALIFEEGRYLHTSKVIAIHGVTPQQIRFETMNSHYCLLAPSSPVAADVPVTVVEQAA